MAFTSTELANALACMRVAHKQGAALTAEAERYKQLAAQTKAKIRHLESQLSPEDAKAWAARKQRL